MFLFCLQDNFKNKIQFEIIRVDVNLESSIYSIVAQISNLSDKPITINDIYINNQSVLLNRELHQHIYTYKYLNSYESIVVSFKCPHIKKEDSIDIQIKTTRKKYYKIKIKSLKDVM